LTDVRIGEILHVLFCYQQIPLFFGRITPPEK